MVISLYILKGTEKKMHATIIIGILKYEIIISAQQNSYLNMLASEKIQIIVEGMLGKLI